MTLISHSHARGKPNKRRERDRDREEKREEPFSIGECRFRTMLSMVPVLPIHEILCMHQ